MTLRQQRWNSPSKVPIGNASQPLYHRVYRQISEEIESGALQAGDRLPSERWLCDELGVSRATVRRAIEELVLDGLVEGDRQAVEHAQAVQLEDLGARGDAEGLGLVERGRAHLVGEHP